jgi:hypothetical protein
MLAAPFVRGQITLREFSPANREFLKAFIDRTLDPTYDQNMWPKFEDEMVRAGGDIFTGTYQAIHVPGKLALDGESIYDLPIGTVEWLSAFAVLESIVSTELPFWQLFKIVARSLRQPDPGDEKDRGGIFVGAFMAESEGWAAGENTAFPAVKLNIDRIEKAAKDADLEFVTIPLAMEDNVVRFREGYKGMVLMVAWPRRSRSGRHSAAPLSTNVMLAA